MKPLLVPMSSQQIEQTLQARGLDPELALLIKETIPGDVAEVVSRTEFLALQLKYGYARAVALVRDRIALRELELALRASAPTADVYAAAEVGLLGRTFEPVARESVRGSFLRGARVGTQALRRLEVQLRFDLMNPHAAQFARTQTGQLITGIDESQREAVQNLVESAVANGRTVQDIARDIRNVVGFRPDQVEALSKYREVLAGRNLDQDALERKVRRYADALVRQRGELIARTEILRAANTGQVESWLEARRQGLLDRTYGKQWVTTPDELLCPICEALDGETTSLMSTFSAGVDVPPEHPNCRCTIVLTKLEEGP
jgi:SPP1 gp7 family putative phage head morphogenesis protein